MENKKFNGFNDEGCLPFGVYEMSLEEFEEIFSKNQSSRRQLIMKYYKEHINQIRSLPYYLNHWIDGSYVTSKENPNDIDTFTEFDGVKVDEDDDKALVEDLIYNAPLRTYNTCHSFMVYKYPESYKEEYEDYLELKSMTLVMLFAVNKKTRNPKGFVKLKN